MESQPPHAGTEPHVTPAAPPLAPGDAPAPGTVPSNAPVAPAATSMATGGAAGSPPSSPAASPPGPSPAGSRPPPDRVRTNVKVAGVVLILVGALTGWQFMGAALSLDHVLSDEDVRPVADHPGGNITVQLLGGGVAQVRFFDLNGTHLSNATTAPDGRLVAAPGRAAVRVEVESNGTTWMRKAFSTPGLPTELTLDPASSPASQDAWVQPDLSSFRWVWGVVALAAFLIVAGVLAFRMRGPNLTLVAAGLFLLGALAMAAVAYRAAGANFGYLMQPLLYAAMALFCVWAIRQGRDRMATIQAGPVRL